MDTTLAVSTGLFATGFLFLTYNLVYTFGEISQSIKEFQMDFISKMKDIERDLKLIAESVNDNSSWNKPRNPNA